MLFGNSVRGRSAGHCEANSTITRIGVQLDQRLDVVGHVGERVDHWVPGCPIVSKLIHDMRILRVHGVRVLRISVSLRR
jgi:hypothetical protein